MAAKWILIADDEVELLSLYEEYFSGQKEFKVVTAKDGAEAYTKSRMQKFDVILTDYRMPRLNGVQLIGALRENPLNSSTPINVITGYAEEVHADLFKAKLVNNITVLQKPVSLDTLGKIADKVSSNKTEGGGNFTIDVNFLNPYMKAVEMTLKEMARIQQITPGKPFLLTEDQTIKVDISSNLAVMSRYFSGNIVIAFPKDTFLKVASEVLGEAQGDITNDNRDLVGELTNIIFGKAKMVWNESGFSVQKAIPSVVDGADHQIRSSRIAPSIVVPYESTLGTFNAIISVFKSPEVIS